MFGRKKPYPLHSAKQLAAYAVMIASLSENEKARELSRAARSNDVQCAEELDRSVRNPLALVSAAHDAIAGDAGETLAVIVGNTRFPRFSQDKISALLSEAVISDAPFSTFVLGHHAYQPALEAAAQAYVAAPRGVRAAAVLLDRDLPEPVKTAVLERMEPEFTARGGMHEKGWGDYPKEVQEIKGKSALDYANRPYGVLWRILHPLGKEPSATQKFMDAIFLRDNVNFNVVNAKFNICERIQPLADDINSVDKGRADPRTEGLVKLAKLATILRLPVAIADATLAAGRDVERLHGLDRLLKGEPAAKALHNRRYKTNRII
jgi:hypothetical protein